jgi:hypothetical protein
MTKYSNTPLHTKEKSFDFECSKCEDNFTKKQTKVSQSSFENQLVTANRQATYARTKNKD